MVIPLLHRNTQTYIGMKNRENYLATNVVDGMFIALSDKGKLQAWDMITGKKLPPALGEKYPSFKIYKDFEVYAWVDKDEKY
jgi:hypothetical protein